MRTVFIFISAIVLSVLATLLIACGDDSSGGDGDVTVVASTPQLSDLASQVAGDRAEVVGILSVNADPHEYEPQPSDAEALVDADLVLQSGGDVDTWLDDLVESSETDAPKLTLIDEVTTIEGGHDHAHEHEHEAHSHEEEAHSHDGETDADEEAHSHEDEEAHSREEEEGHSHEEGTDPHWWQNPQNAVAAVEAIESDLSEVDPEGAEEYERNAAAYIEQLERLDAEIERCMDRVPVEDRNLVTSHDALGYYADRYGIEVVGTTIPALTTQAQPSAGETAKLIREIREADVSTIFPEAGVSGDLEQAIADQADATVGGELWADGLGPEGSDGETYADAIRSNTEKLVEAFSDGKVACELAE